VKTISSGSILVFTLFHIQFNSLNRYEIIALCTLFYWRCADGGAAYGSHRTGERNMEKVGRICSVGLLHTLKERVADHRWFKDRRAHGRLP
jgi:hypothetical protein